MSSTQVEKYDKTRKFNELPLCFLELSAVDLIVVLQNMYAETLTFNASLFGKADLRRH